MNLTKRLSIAVRSPAFATAVLLSLAGISPPGTAAECQAIVFKPGTTSAKFHGTVQPEDHQCFSFGSGKGQSVRLSVKSKSGNVAFTINDVVDNRDRFEFTSEKKTYEFILYQTLRSVTPDDFTLSLSIK